MSHALAKGFDSNLCWLKIIERVLTVRDSLSTLLVKLAMIFFHSRLSYKKWLFSRISPLDLEIPLYNRYSKSQFSGKEMEGVGGITMGKSWLYEVRMIHYIGVSQ